MSELRDVVIPAGGRIPEAYAHAAGTPYRALAPLGTERRPVLQIVVDALRSSGSVRRIVCVAAPQVAATISGVDHWLPAGERGTENILRGLASLDDPAVPALVCTSDLPLLTPPDVQKFVSQCDTYVDVTLGLVTASSYETAFREAPSSQWVTLRDVGPVTMVGLFGIRPAILLRQEALLASVFESRKSQLRMIRMLGPRLIWQWATKTLTLQTLVTRGEKILGGRAQILRDAPPRLSFDIDTQDDYAYADTCLREKRRTDTPRTG
jgi:GTP:adenosylcobinamide-phosphate guanylyltransferase